MWWIGGGLEWAAVGTGHSGLIMINHLPGHMSMAATQNRFLSDCLVHCSTLCVDICDRRSLGLNKRMRLLFSDSGPYFILIANISL